MMPDTPLAPALNAATAGRDLPIADFVALAGRAGYGWVELDRAQIVPLVALGQPAAAALLGSAAVRIASFFLPVAWRGDDATFERDMATLPEIARVAAALGTPCGCTWMLPNFPTPPIETRVLVGRRLRRVAALLADHGLRLGLEFVGPAHLRSEPGSTFLYRMEDVLAFSLELGPNVGILVDALHWHCVGGTEAALAAIPNERLVHVHVDDAPDKPRELVRDDERLLPGEGIIDLAGFARGLLAAGYRAPVGIEIDGPRLRGLDPDIAAVRARAAWERVLRPG